MRMHGSGLRRMAMVAVLAAAATGCASVSHTQASDPFDGNAPLGTALQSGQTGLGNYLAGQIAIRRENFDDAGDLLQKSLVADPTNVDLMRATFLVLLPSGKLKDASDVAARIGTYGGTLALANLLLAEQAAHAGDWTKADAQIPGLNASKSAVGHLTAPVVTAWVRVGQGRVDDGLHALDAFGTATTPSVEQYMRDYNTALIDDLADRKAPADSLYHKLTAPDTDPPMRTVEAAVLFFRRNNEPQDAADLLARYTKTHPQIPLLDIQDNTPRLVPKASDGIAEMLFSVLNILQQQRGENPDEVLDLGRLTLDSRPDFPIAQAILGDILQQLGRLDEADAVFASLQVDSNLGWSAQLRIAQNLGEMGRNDDAIALLQKLATAHPDRADAQIALGDFYRFGGHWPEAVAAYNHAVTDLGDLGPGDWRVLYARGIALDRSKQWPLAQADFVKALSLQPSQPEVLNYLGYSWLEQGINLTEARRMIEEAVASSPSSGYIIDSLGWLQFRAGQYGDAVKTLQRAIELEPADADINEHLGDALWADGRQDDARFQWTQALVFTPDPSEKAEIQQKLKNGFTPPPPLQTQAQGSASPAK